MKDNTKSALTALGAVLLIVVAAIGGASVGKSLKATEVRVETQTVTTTLTTTATATATTTATVTAPPVTVTETAPPVTQTETVTETATVTETVTQEAPLPVEPSEAADWTSGCRGYWIPRPGLISEGFYALTKFDGSHVLYDPATPAYLRQLVCVHEGSHVLQAQHYGSVTATPGDYERVADCMSVLQGWSGSLVYGCDDRSMATAKEILNG